MEQVLDLFKHLTIIFDCIAIISNLNNKVNKNFKKNYKIFTISVFGIDSLASCRSFNFLD